MPRRFLSDLTLQHKTAAFFFKLFCHGLKLGIVFDGLLVTGQMPPGFFLVLLYLACTLSARPSMAEYMVSASSLALILSLSLIRFISAI